jgi:CRISPR-associated protein Cas2
MTIVVTRNSPERFRGFLASCMCEIAPGVYTAPRMASSVRDRVWDVLTDWFKPAAEHAILMTWPDQDLPGGQAIRVLGIARHDLWDHHGVFLAKREISAAEIAELAATSGPDMGPPADAS